MTGFKFSLLTWLVWPIRIPKSFLLFKGEVFVKRNMTLFSVFLILATMVFSIGCSKDVVTLSYPFVDFNDINISSAYKVEITKADSFSITITTDSDKIDFLEVTQVSNRLSVGIVSHSPLIDFDTLEAKIALPDIFNITLLGAIKAELRGFNFNHSFRANLSGASNFSGEMETGDVQFVVDGASRLKLSGSGNNMLADIYGASSVNLSDFTVSNATIFMSSASNATVNLDGILNANLSGASKLVYKGNPSLGAISTSESSTISGG